MGSDVNAAMQRSGKHIKITFWT